MARIVIECGEAGYWAAFGMIEEDKFPWGKVVRKFLIVDTGYIYLESDSQEISEGSIPDAVRLASKIAHEKEPKLNVLKG